MQATLDENPEDVGHRIRRALDIRFSDQVDWKRKGSLEPFKAWRRAIENLDVLVFQMGGVHWNEACGFAFYNQKAAQWKTEWEIEQSRRKKKQQESDTDFKRNPSRDLFYNLGRPFVRLVLDSMNANVMTLHEASGHFGNLRVRHFPKLEQRVYTI